MIDNIEEARRLVEEPSGDWDAVERSRQLIEGAGYFPAATEEDEDEEEDEIERARRRAALLRELSIAAGFVLAIAVILSLVFGVPA